MKARKLRLAIIVSHPIQYYAPLYRRLALREDLESKVFFTWHAGAKAEYDPGFGKAIAWDIALTGRYDFELVHNVARRPGSDHFWGIRTPSLVPKVLEWKPDVVHVTGYAYAAHLSAMRRLSKEGVPIIFRGDSHLLNQPPGWRWILKKQILNKIYETTAACLYVGENNYDYYRRIGVPVEKLFFCPHSIDVHRFVETSHEFENKARQWRVALGIPSGYKTILYAGKFEQQKRTLQLLRNFTAMNLAETMLILVGDGPVANHVRELAAGRSNVIILPFQNQEAMPIVYRLGDLVTLPSAYETWGLALNEAIASGRRVLASDKVGGAADLVKDERDGAIFRHDDWAQFEARARTLLRREADLKHLRARSTEFDIPVTEDKLMAVAYLLGVAKE